ncbi:hypothetical protein FA95DRAFT_1553059 [Auriscalpium vulgare]|uniref:Uncharacterized protein n=1 Tax=Auriscalpium vulgare TaxID=40419 RepID=A0ACB8S9J0_9AGAM|nr:hypothetical protein FA95DRAFT_1553059 [Auriscalpium vulgare]
MASLTAPLRGAYRYLQRQAHEQPVIFYSVVIGAIGPVVAFGVPPIRKHFGYEAAERIPNSYPLPNRPRRPVQGYEDEE